MSQDCIHYSLCLHEQIVILKSLCLVDCFLSVLIANTSPACTAEILTLSSDEKVVSFVTVIDI